MTENLTYYQDLIYLYLDGEASDAEKKVLFDKLSQNSELQEEFSRAMELNKAMGEDREFLSPSIELTQKLFIRAGFIPAAELAPIGFSGSGLLGSLMNSGRIIMQNLGAGLVAASVLFTGYNLVEKFDNAKIKDANNRETTAYLAKYNQKAENRTESNTNSSRKSVPMVSSIEDNSKPVIRNNSKSNFEKSLSSKNTLLASKHNKKNTINASDESLAANNSMKEPLADNIDNNNSDNSNNEISSQLESYQAPERINAANIDNNKKFYSLDYHQFMPNAFAMDFPEDLNISLRVSGISGIQYYPSRDIEKSGQLLNNISLCVSYHFDDHQSIGIFAGREALQLYDVEQLDKKYTFDKQPNILWAGLNYKYNLGAISGIVPVNPYADLTIGGTKYGPITKLGLGINYPLTNSITLGLGYEFTSLMYSEFATYKFTHKSGIIYNLSYKF